MTPRREHSTLWMLDSSAVIARLLDESGASRIVEAVLEGAVITSVNAAEVAQRMASAGARAGLADDALVALPVFVIPVARDAALAAGEMYLHTRSLGLGIADRICLACARELDATVLTGDRAMAKADVGVRVELIR